MTRSKVALQSAVTRSLLRREHGGASAGWKGCTASAGGRTSGWYESSWDLQQGLEVTESAADESDLCPGFAPVLPAEG